MLAFQSLQKATATSPAEKAEAAKQSSKFSKFSITTTPYKTINAQEILVHVFIPKHLKTGTAPLIVRFHGGFLVTGAALFPDFTAQWALDYTLQHNAIWVSPDYRLLPESKGLDILEDIRDFWTWVQDSLPAYLKSIGSDLAVDYGKVLVYGESAGGYLAVQSAPTQSKLVKAVISAFPMIELDAPWYSQKVPGKSPFHAPDIPQSVLDGHLASLPKGAIATVGYPPERIPLALFAIQQGIYTEWLGQEDELYPLRVLEKMEGNEEMPFLFAFHGTDDTAVPDEGTRKLVKVWGEKFGVEKVHGSFQKGDHGFDGGEKLEAGWLQDGLKGVTSAWLG
jgi:hypothetical protein